MTAAELIQILSREDPTTLITLDTRGHGQTRLYPVEDQTLIEDIEIDGEIYHCLILQLGNVWP